MEKLAIILIVFFASTQNQNSELNGKYKTELIHGNNYTLVIKDTLFSKIYKSGAESKGIVKYEKNNIYLYSYKSHYELIGDRIVTRQSKDIETNEVISFKKDRIDTIAFCFHKFKENGPINWLDICVETGKFIKIE